MRPLTVAMLMVFAACPSAARADATESLVEEARRGPLCSLDRIRQLEASGARVPVADWMVWYPEVVGCGDLPEKAYLATAPSKREALALLGISGVLEQFQKLRTALRDDVTRGKSPGADGRERANRIAHTFHFLRDKMVQRCSKGSRVACDIARRANAFRTSLATHLKSARRSSEVTSLPRRARKPWLRALQDTAGPFIH